MARTLNVFLNEDRVGLLEQDDGGSLWFRYDSEWLSSAEAMPLSHSLPLKPDAFKRNECRPFFAGLLPEEESRLLVAKGFGVSDKNDFAILERIGAECAGAVSILPEGQVPLAASRRYQEISPSELEERIALLPKHPLLAGEVGIKLSLAGAQSKLAMAIADGRISLPLDGAPSTHILKPESPHFDGLVDNEFFCMRLAAAVGLDVANVEVGTAGQSNYLQVERYDRLRTPDSTLIRLHQEDFCQALGIPPELKYQNEGGPNLRRCFELIRKVSSAPGLDILHFFDAVIFNFLIGNNDAHGKNFSFLRDAEWVRIAPLYDLVCTRAYAELSTTMAMKIGDERDPVRLKGRNWIKFFRDAGLGEAPASKRLRSLARRTEESVSVLLQEFPKGEPVAAVVRKNCASLLGNQSLSD